MKKVLQGHNLTVTIESDGLTDSDFEDSLFFQKEGKEYMSFDRISWDNNTGELKYYWKGNLIITQSVSYLTNGVDINGIQGRVVVNRQ